MTPRPRAVGSVLLALATILVYARTASNGFVGYDDPAYVFRNEVVRNGLSTDGLLWAFRAVALSNWHPLTWVSHMLDVQLFGLNPGAHHLMNLGMHAGSAVLLFLTLFQATSRLWRSLAVAALFALHPLHVESVAWVAERKDVLSGLLFHLTLLAYVAYVRKPGAVRYAATLLSFAIGLLAKPMLVTLPAVMLLLDGWPLARERTAAHGVTPRMTRWFPLLLEKVPFLTLSAASSAVTLYAQRRGGSVVDLAAAPLGFRLANAVAAVGGYVEKALWPRGLAVLYPLADPVDAWHLVIGVAALVALFAAILVGGRRRGYLATGGLWFLAMLLPVLGIIQVGAQAMADRYAYLPLTGLFVVVVWGGADLLRAFDARFRMLSAVAGVAIAACAMATWVQIGYWKDSLTLYRHALDVTRRNLLMVNNYGAALDEAGRHEEAIRFLEHAMVTESANRSRYYYLLLDTYASALDASGRPRDAVAALERAISAKPSHAQSYYELGRILHVTFGDLDAAAALYRRALELEPDYLDAYINLGGALNAASRFGEGLEVLQRAERLGRSRPELHFNLGVSYEGIGQSDAALREAEALRRLEPELSQRLLVFIRERGTAAGP